MRYVNFTKDTFLFQFHEGPIKTPHSIANGVLLPLFQFHEGPIKTFDFEVREHGLIMFQFHEGPIKTELVKDACNNLFVSIP